MKVKKIGEAVPRVVEDPDFRRVTKYMGTYYSFQNSAGFGKSLAEYKEAYAAFLKEEGMVK